MSSQGTHGNAPATTTATTHAATATKDNVIISSQAPRAPPVTNTTTTAAAAAAAAANSPPSKTTTTVAAIDRNSAKASKNADRKAAAVPPASTDDHTRLRSTVMTMSRSLQCVITEKLMVDPVVAQDGHTYERSAIEQWLGCESSSPLDPTFKLDPSRLMSNRMAKTQIEELIASGELEEDECADYVTRRYLLSQELYDEDKVEEAAELGLPKAQGVMADRYYFGEGGVRKDPLITSYSLICLVRSLINSLGAATADSERRVAHRRSFLSFIR